VVKVGQVAIGGGEFVVMAGPCSIESEEQLMESAYTIKKGAAHILRGGAYKPRTSPYSFQGMEEEGLKLLKKAREKFGLPVITEVMNTTEVDLVEIQYPQMDPTQNFPLLKKVGKCQSPCVVRHDDDDQELSCPPVHPREGNEEVILCERGSHLRNGDGTWWRSSSPERAHHLPVVDPSLPRPLKYVIPLAEPRWP
jgi:3-deoxy-7-phosphoheptulonate synthase